MTIYYCIVGALILLAIINEYKTKSYYEDLTKSKDHE